MGALDGHRQVSVYVEDDVWEMATIIARRTKRPIYKLVSDAVRAEVEKHTTPAERKAVLAFLKGTGGKKNGRQHPAGRHEKNGTTKNGTSQRKPIPARPSEP